MKIFTLLLTLLISGFAYGESEVISATDICAKSANLWALKSEAKQTKSKIDKIKSTQLTTLGSGINLYLVSIFVEGPNTGDNTHWVVVGEFSAENNSCNILIGRRYWAH